MPQPKLLTIDIENAPNIADVWALFDQNVGLAQLRERARMISWAAKWHGKSKVLFASEYHDGRESMIDQLWELFDEADIIMGYNSTRFDVPHVNREFIQAGYTPPSPFLQIDLIRTARYQFKFASNKLDNVCYELGLPQKVAHHGHTLWRECLDAGVDSTVQARAWDLMRKYNKQDVRSTELVYDTVLPWIRNHPHMGLLSGSKNDVCGRCGSVNIKKRGRKPTGVSLYQQYRCDDCGGWSRGKKAIAGIDVRPIS